MSLKPLPNLDDSEAVLTQGRRSMLMKCRKEAMEALRDAYTMLQSATIDSCASEAQDVIDATNRIIEIAGLWK